MRLRALLKKFKKKIFFDFDNRQVIFCGLATYPKGFSRDFLIVENCLENRILQGAQSPDSELISQ